MFDAHDILNSLSEIIYVSDAENKKIIYMNKAAAELLGDCVGKTRDEAVSGKLTLHKEQIYKNNDSAVTRIYTGVNGVVYAVYSNSSVLDGKNVIIETAVDITAAEEERIDLEARLEREHVIVSCIIEMQQDKPFDETIYSVLSMTGKFLDADRVYLFKYNGGVMSKTHSWHAEGMEDDDSSLQNLDAHMVDRWLEVFGGRECVLLNDIELIKDNSSEEYRLLKELKVQRMVAAPLYVEGNLVGFIGVDNLPKEKMMVGEVFFAALSNFISLMIIREQNESSLRKMSYIDTLTNIYNRNKFIEDCETMATAGETNVGVVYMDLNGLKGINDKKGHHAGDAALRRMADIILEVFDRQTVYRVGGDEFVVFCRDTDEESFRKRVDLLFEKLDESEYKMAVGVQYAGDGSDINDIIKSADENMYRDKKYFYRNSGQSGRYRVSNDTFIAISTPERIKNLINEERFVIWFQPRFSAHTGEFCGSEALIRFFGEDDMIISPMDFIPEMEDNDTIHLIDFYVFRHVCEYISGWIKNGRNVKPVSINISHSTLRKPNFIENIMDIWYDYNVPKEFIVIEVSEDQDNGGISDIIGVLTDLKKCGFQLAIDNFGSKYADLYLFADLKFDILKLDGDMVYKIETDKKTQLLSMSIMQICHNEHIKIVAEGVENEKELKVLKEIGCDEVQGYLFDKPMSWNWFEQKYL